MQFHLLAAMVWRSELINGKKEQIAFTSVSLGNAIMFIATVSNKLCSITVFFFFRETTLRKPYSHLES